MAEKQYEIWQLKKDIPDAADMLFMNYDYLTKHGYSIDMSK